MRIRIVMPVLFVLISILQWDVVRNSLLSLALYVALSVGALDPTRFWSADLFEFWLAGCVWVFTGASMALWIPRVSRRRAWRLDRLGLPESVMASRLKRTCSAVVLSAVYISLVCPIVAPFAPNVQGDLVVGRLLPPMSAADVFFRSPLAEDPGGEEGFGEWYRAVNQQLRSGVRQGSPTSLFVFGTDALGRDVFSRVVYATRVSFGIGVTASIGALFVGLCAGLASGLAGRRLDAVLMRCTDLFLSIPQLFVVLAVIAVFGGSVVALVLALVLTGWMSIARVVRDEVRRLRNAEFILAARMMMVPSVTIAFRHLLPNIRPVLVTAGVLQFANVILAEAALGFLGLGIQPPTPTWGNMMGEATAYLGNAWWLAFFPGLFLSILVVSIHLAAESDSQGAGTDAATTHGHS